MSLLTLVIIHDRLQQWQQFFHCTISKGVALWTTAISFDGPWSKEGWTGMCRAKVQCYVWCMCFAGQRKRWWDNSESPWTTLHSERKSRSFEKWWWTRSSHAARWRNECHRVTVDHKSTSTCPSNRRNVQILLPHRVCPFQLHLLALLLHVNGLMWRRKIKKELSQNEAPIKCPWWSSSVFRINIYSTLSV